MSPPVLDLSRRARPAALIEQRAGEAAHQQQRHQVLEHRAAPRHQRGSTVHARDQAPEVEPVVLRHVALGDGDEAGESRFRRQQIVERAVRAAGTIGVREPVADREDAPPAIVEKTKPHLVGQQRGAGSQRVQRGVVLLERLRGPAHAGNGLAEGPNPEGEIAVRVLDGRRAGHVHSGQLLAEREQRIQHAGLDRLSRRRGDLARQGDVLRRRPPSITAVVCRGDRRQHFGGVDHAFETLGLGLRCESKLSQALRQRNQGAREVAAVHRRDIVRPQRRQGRGVVPVQEVAFVTFQPLERGQGPVEPFHERVGRRRSPDRARRVWTAGSSRRSSARCGGPVAARRHSPDSCPAAATRCRLSRTFRRTAR